MTSRSTKSLAILLSLILFVLICILAYGIYSIRSTNEETSVLLNMADEKAEEEILIQSIRSLQAGSRESVDAFEKFVLTQDKLVSTIETIEDLGSGLGLETSISSVDRVEEKGSSSASTTSSNEPQKIRIVMEAKGHWQGVFAFLRGIESLPHRITIDDASLSKSEEGWQSRISLLLYSFNN